MSAEKPAHIERLRSSVGGGTRITLHTAGRFVRARAWTWPLILAAVMATAGWFLRITVEQTLQEKMRSELQTLLDADVTALRIWFAGQQDIAEAAAQSPGLQRAVTELVRDVEAGRTPQEILSSPEAAEVHALLGPVVGQHGFHGYGIVTSDGVIALATQDFLVGTSIPKIDRPLIADVMERNASLVTPPRRSSLPFQDESGQFQTGVPTMYAMTPVRDAAGAAVAVLVFRMPPEEQFSQILHVARMGESGETYAFSRDGLLLSQSRFDDELKRIGLLVDSPDSHSILSVELRDPGVNMVDGARPDVLREDQPLTHTVRSAVQNGAGCDVDGYNDYRGVPVVGAWTWLDDYDFGVATEVDVAEAYKAFYILRRFALANFGLLVVASLGMLVASRVIAGQQTKLRQAAIDSRRLGQYTLEQKLGEGGMGEVYRGHHAMLRRPTAVKLMHPHRTSEDSIARFEREVQLTSQLTHPNTIAIYDYGRTPEGVFYYAMEYVDGISLDDLVAEDGPQPEGRVIHILRQVCGSLAEAHEMGVVHRDVKPANIMLTRRGGIADVVKVLDFGLVKALDAEQENALTAANSLTGTPHYMSPEAIQRPDTVDARSDLYAIGAVGYFLLTGTPVFDGQSAMAVCTQHIQTAPEPPSERIGRSIAEDLQALILSCLQKDPDERPPSARNLAAALDACLDAGNWSDADAREWWSRLSDGTSGQEFEYGADAGAATLIVGRDDAAETR